MQKKLEEWLLHNQAWEQSGLTQIEYCKQNGIVYGGFKSARTKLLKSGLISREPHSGFQELDLESVVSKAHEPLFYRDLEPQIQHEVELELFEGIKLTLRRFQ